MRDYRTVPGYSLGSFLHTTPKALYDPFLVHVHIHFVFSIGLSNPYLDAERNTMMALTHKKSEKAVIVDALEVQIDRVALGLLPNFETGRCKSSGRGLVFKVDPLPSNSDYKGY